MEYTNWDSLMIILFKNSVEINTNLIMRRDIDTMDNDSIKILLGDISNSMSLDSIKTPNGLSNCNDWDEIGLRLILNEEIYQQLKTTRTEFDNKQINLGHFLYDIYITLL